MTVVDSPVPNHDTNTLDSDDGKPSHGDIAATKLEGLKKYHERQRDGLVLMKRPYATIKYFTMAIVQYLGQFMSYMASHKLLVLVACLIVFGWTTFCTVEGPHARFMKEVSFYMQYVLWWAGLGIASSIGLGYGWHTFVLYLGPHIAMFTIKATLCGRVDLKSSHYDTVLFGKGPSWAFKDCLDFGEPMFPKAASSERFRVPMLAILHKVHWEAILWGVGTALGELPPYFVTRAAKLSGDRLKEFKDFSSADSSGAALSFLKKIKFNFWTILLLASVPNPLFDLAGMICGHVLVPFWEFFIATLIGKAFFKTHLQTVFVILLCNNQLLEQLESRLRQAFRNIPAVYRFINHVFLQLAQTKQNYDNGVDTAKASSWKLSFSSIWSTLIWIMLIGFLSSIINATAQSFLLEEQKREIEKFEEHGKDLSARKNRDL